VTRWLLIGPVAVVAFDTLGAVAARTFDFEYGSLWPLSVLLAVTVAFLAGRDTGLIRVGVLVGLSLGFANSTLGWAVSWLIGPGAPAPADRDALTVGLTILAVTAVGSIEGFVGGWLGAWRTRSRSLGSND
jgi:hypothetical protein